MAESPRLVRPHILRKDFGGGNEELCTAEDERGEVLALFPRRKVAEEFMKISPGCASMKPYAPVVA